MPQLNLADWTDCTEVEGPGRRIALWTQGCLKCCVGCCNPHMLDIVPRHVLDCDEVIAWIRSAAEKHGIEGVTFLGGEPLLQARGLACLAQHCQRQRLSVMLFTGYTLAELDSLKLAGTDELLTHTDVLVDGPYRQELQETRRNWAGSTNQQFHFLSGRYTPGVEFDPAFRPAIEFRIQTRGRIRLNGWPVPVFAARTNVTEE